MVTLTLPQQHFAPPPFPVWRFTVDEYHRLINAGFLGENDRVEFLEGWIVPKNAHSPPHDGTKQIVSDRLRRRLPQEWDIRIQSAVTLADSEPEPDLAIVRNIELEYLTRHPGPSDIGLLIEVADSSLLQDQQDKARIYARAGIAAYWIINLVDGRVEIFSDPTGPAAQPAYRSCTSYRDEELVPLVLEGVEIARIPAKDLLP